jgi:hypothetical protein
MGKQHTSVDPSVTMNRSFVFELKMVYVHENCSRTAGPDSPPTTPLA